jgi:hypothetical protein
MKLARPLVRPAAASIAPPNHEGRSGLKLSTALQHEVLRFDRHYPDEAANALSPFFFVELLLHPDS